MTPEQKELLVLVGDKYSLLIEQYKNGVLMDVYFSIGMFVLFLIILVICCFGLKKHHHHPFYITGILFSAIFMLFSVIIGFGDIIRLNNPDVSMIHYLISK